MLAFVFSTWFGRAAVAFVMRVSAVIAFGALQVVVAFECAPMRDTVPPANVSYADSLLWEIEGPGRRRGFLFGTIHLAADSVGQPTNRVSAALMDSEQFGMEMMLDLEAMFGVSGAMQLEGKQRLSKLVGAALFDRAVERLSAYGVTREQADSLKPWAVYTTLSLPARQFSLPLDMVLMTTAQQADKKAFGLETLSEQTDAFEQISLKDQTELLRDVVCHYEQLQQDTEDLVAHYSRGDLRGLYRIAHRHDSPLNDRLLEGLLIKRNRRMVDRLHRHLQDGRAFVAIGALHLPGPEGVLALLVARGYRVKPLAAH